nr:MAG TPA: hypothetical protein [Caudoviricetes sp.]DAX68876.1 MAG TPA: hypothetical protein [Caudoviricetes sp.]
MVTKQPTYIFDENGELHFLPEGSELSDHVLSQVSNPHVTGLSVPEGNTSTEDETSDEPEDEKKKSPARKPRARRSTAKK